jgi:hypothetical protein
MDIEHWAEGKSSVPDYPIDPNHREFWAILGYIAKWSVIVVLLLLILNRLIGASQVYDNAYEKFFYMRPTNTDSYEPRKDIPRFEKYQSNSGYRDNSDREYAPHFGLERYTFPLERERD